MRCVPCARILSSSQRGGLVQCRADSTCRHQSEKGLVILAHFPFGPRGSTVSGRHLHATYGDFATTFASASFSFVCRYRPKGRPLGVVRPPAPPCCFPCVFPQHSRA